jgi:hypothetical protein
MVYRVVSTKLTEEEHDKLLDACNTRGCTPFALLKEALMEKIEPKEQPQSMEKSRNMSDEEIRKFLGIKPKIIGIKKS